jgi:ESS family glutamate:Na+ symporter
MTIFSLDLIQTLALAAVVLLLGYDLRKRIGILDRYNIPAPVIGGFLFAGLAMSFRMTDMVGFTFDTTLQSPLMIAFFTTIGLGANLRLLKVGGPQVILFWILASILAVVQSGVGILLAKGMGVDPFLGIIAGSMTMTGGHGTGAAFGKLMEDQYAFSGAVTLAMAAATFGLVSGGLIGGPVATRLIQRWHPHHKKDDSARAPVEITPDDEVMLKERTSSEGGLAFRLLRTIGTILIAMWAGSLLSSWLGQYVTLPAYIGSMLVAAVICNVAPAVNVRLDGRMIEDLGMVALSLFLTMALMSLRLWELLDLAIPLIVILTVQVAMMAAYATWVVFRFMGRDYDAAVMAGGHCGFGLGATPNAVANMEALTERYGPAPRAFLVLPMVGAFFIDFTNAIIITTYINLVAP